MDEWLKFWELETIKKYVDSHGSIWRFEEENWFNDVGENMLNKYNSMSKLMSLSFQLWRPPTVSIISKLYVYKKPNSENSDNPELVFYEHRITMCQKNVLAVPELFGVLDLSKITDG